MIIHAFGEEFEVIHVDRKQECEILQCYVFSENKNYILLHYTEYELVRYLLPYYFHLMENDAFKDYRGCFTEQGELYLAFYKGYGRPLENLVQGGTLSFARRLLLGRRILEKLLLWKLPCGIAAQILDVSRILVDGENIAFDYAWEETAKAEDDFHILAVRVADLIEFLCNKEMKSSVGTKLTDFITGLEQEKMKTILAIYEGYCTMCETLPCEFEEEISEMGHLKAIYTRCLERMQKSLEEILVLIGYLLVLALLIAGLQKQKEEEQGAAYTEIGTLSVQETEK